MRYSYHHSCRKWIPTSLESQSVIAILLRHSSTMFYLLLTMIKPYEPIPTINQPSIYKPIPCHGISPDFQGSQWLEELPGLVDLVTGNLFRHGVNKLVTIGMSPKLPLVGSNRGRFHKPRKLQVVDDADAIPNIPAPAKPIYFYQKDIISVVNTFILTIVYISSWAVESSIRLRTRRHIRIHPFAVSGKWSWLHPLGGRFSRGWFIDGYNYGIQSSISWDKV